ncbi:CPBP family intramembrane glutamic endopeptidase [Desmospora activa]|uniref:CAAX prenyl protease 2/Lysostaphin resistance protein A-like domain-containing protein n=1 Tax=Desmospora activa DSM 45169 TaxID=1121389 RepID=A0A2T4Z4F5_9BACL|nr:type II CAAX endopeptidase family protein [Desmospora activa]PTM56774.1 hypothetical protein C8J48_3099 [Desmospora activa DSM 45169]
MISGPIETLLEIISVIMMLLPMLLLLLFANLAQRGREQNPEGNGGLGWTITTHILVAISFSLLFIVGAVLTLFGLLTGSASNGDLAGMSGVTANFIESMVPIGLGLTIPALIGILLQIPIIRRGLMKPLPLDPSNAVHTFALVATMIIWINFFITMAIGLEALTNTDGAQKNIIPSLWTQQITFFIIALIGVGWLTRRNWREVCQRLGLVRPSGVQWVLGIVMGFGLVVFANVLSYVATWLGFPLDPNVEQLTDQLLSPLFGSVLGILTLGLSAALGEEALFRGAMQPRFGLLLTSVLFAFVHSNYGLSLSTLVVFCVGLALGLIRMRHNTSTAMIVHATYNMTLGVLASMAG